MTTLLSLICSSHPLLMTILTTIILEISSVSVTICLRNPLCETVTWTEFRWQFIVRVIKWVVVQLWILRSSPRKMTESCKIYIRCQCEQILTPSSKLRSLQTSSSMSSRYERLKCDILQSCSVPFHSLFYAVLFSEGGKSGFKTRTRRFSVFCHVWQLRSDISKAGSSKCFGISA